MSDQQPPDGGQPQPPYGGPPPGYEQQPPPAGYEQQPPPPGPSGYGPLGPSGYGQPPAYGAQGPSGQYGGPPSEGRRRAVPFLIAAALLGVVAVVLVLVFVVFNGGSNKPAADDPSSTVQSFLQSFKDQDCAAMTKLVTQKLKGNASLCSFDGTAKITFSDPKTRDQTTTTAHVSFTVRLSGQAFPTTFTLVRTDGTWLIDDVGN